MWSSFRNQFHKRQKPYKFSRRINNTHRQRTTGSIEHQTPLTGMSQRSRAQQQQVCGKMVQQLQV